MRRFDFRWVPLVIAAGAFLGSALVSSVAVASDESPPIDEPVLVFEPTPSDVEAVDPADPAIIEAVDPADPAIIEVVDGVTPPDETAAPLDAVVAAPALRPVHRAPHDRGIRRGPRRRGRRPGQSVPHDLHRDLARSERDADRVPRCRAPDRRANAVRTLRIQQTGKGLQTSATCTYPAGSDVLECVFDNPGHGSGTDGLVVPARPTATYTVTVKWPPPDWTIDGANAGPYSARDLCPREEGAGHEGAGGHEGTGEDQGSRRNRQPANTEPGEDDDSGQRPGHETAGGEAGSRAWRLLRAPGRDATECHGHRPAVRPAGRCRPRRRSSHSRRRCAPTDRPATPPVVEPEVDALPPVVAPPTIDPDRPGHAVAPAATAPARFRSRVARSRRSS